MPPEDELLRIQPKMFKARPISFVIVCILCLGLIGIPIMAAWWLATYNRELVVTKNRTRKRTGILSNETTELEHRDVKNIQVEQGPIQRMMGVGTLRLSSAGQAGLELVMQSIEGPEGVRDLIYDQRQ